MTSPDWMLLGHQLDFFIETQIMPGSVSGPAPGTRSLTSVWDLPDFGCANWMQISTGVASPDLTRLDSILFRPVSMYASLWSVKSSIFSWIVKGPSPLILMLGASHPCAAHVAGGAGLGGTGERRESSGRPGRVSVVSGTGWEHEACRHPRQDSLQPCLATTHPQRGQH